MKEKTKSRAISSLVCQALLLMTLLSVGLAACQSLAAQKSSDTSLSQTPLPPWTPPVTGIWSVSPPAETPIPTPARPVYARPTSQPGTPWPTLTLLPDPGVRMGAPVEVSLPPALQATGEQRVRLLFPDFDGHTLVVVAKVGESSAVVALDIETGQAQVLSKEDHALLSQDAHVIWLHDSRVSERYVAWVASRHDGSQNVLYAHDLHTRQATHILDGTYDVDISGTTVVWSQSGDAWDVWGYDLERQEHFPIAAGPGDQFKPLVSKRWAIFMEALPGTMSDGSEMPIRAVNLDTGENIYIGTVNWTARQYTPSLYAIDVPWVAWSTEAQLHLYNLDTRETFTAEPCISTKVIQAVEGDFVHTTNRRPEYLALSENTLIFVCEQRMGYDIERGVFFSLPVRTPATAGGTVGGWAISGNRLVWVLSPESEEQDRIYTAEIER